MVKPKKSRGRQTEKEINFDPRAKAIQEWNDQEAEDAGGEDAFHANRDRIDLEDNSHQFMDDQDIEMDDEVLPLRFAEEKKIKPQKKKSLLNKDANEAVKALVEKKKKKKSNEQQSHEPLQNMSKISRFDRDTLGAVQESDGDDNDQSEGDQEDDFESGSWHPSAYHVRKGQDDVEPDSEDEEAVAMDLAETRRIQKAFRARLNEDDFGLSQEEWDIDLDSNNPTLKTSSKIGSSDDVPTFESRQEEINQFIQSSPQLFLFAKEYIKGSRTLDYVKSRIEEIQKLSRENSRLSVAEGNATVFKNTMIKYLKSLERYFELQFQMNIRTESNDSYKKKNESNLETLSEVAKHVTKLGEFVKNLSKDRKSWDIKSISESENLDTDEQQKQEEQEQKSKRKQKKRKRIPSAVKRARAMSSSKDNDQDDFDQDELDSDEYVDDDLEENQNNLYKALGLDPSEYGIFGDSDDDSEQDDDGDDDDVGNADQDDDMDIDDQENDDKALKRIPFTQKKKPRLDKLQDQDNEDEEAEDDFIESLRLSKTDKADKADKRKSLRFYTSKIDAKESKRIGGGIKGMGGDDDIPYRNKEQIRRQMLQRQNHNTTSAWDQDGDVDADADLTSSGSRLGPSGMELADRNMDSDHDDDNDDYYNLVKSSKQARKQAKKEEYDEMRNQERRLLAGEEEADDGNPRAISRAMLKNKGLTPNRPKEVRNPRVKKRKRFETAKKKLASKQATYSKERAAAGASGAYDGEKSGIVKNVVKSRKL